MTHRDDFWSCKSLRDCNEWMAHEAIREAERLRDAIAQHKIRPQTVAHAQMRIREHLAYAREIMDLDAGGTQ